MTTSLHRSLRFSFAPAFAALVLAGCGSKGMDSAPRLSLVPDQSVGAGGALNLDLASYVSDKEGDPITWSVTSGGGSFTGSTYTNTFATLGTYTVGVRATDVSGKQANTNFTVRVKVANLAAVAEGDDLRLLDGDTLSFLELNATPGVAETLRTTLGKGHVIYKRVVGSNTDLFAYDPYTRLTATLGNETDRNEDYVAKTTDHKVVFERANPATSDRDLFLWDAPTGTLRTISADASADETGAVVSSENLVYYQRAQGGQYDLYYYDPALDTSVAISTDARNEVIRAAVPGGGIVFTRVGAGGELDLFWFRKSTGTVEIGADLSATMLAQTKTWAGFTSGGKVVFEVTGVTEIDLCVWNPTTGATRVISGSDTGDARFRGANSLDSLVYSIAASPTDANLAYYDYATNVRTVFESSANDATYKAACATGELLYEVTAASRDLNIFVPASLTSVTTLSTGSDETFLGLLANDTIVFTRVGTGLMAANKTATNVVTVMAGTAANFGFGGALAASGDFVFSVDAGGQNDLYVWDESALTSSAITTHLGHEIFGAELSGERVLFTRVETANTTSDLFLWVRGTNVITRLTTTSVNHAVAAYYVADRN